MRKKVPLRALLGGDACGSRQRLSRAAFAPQLRRADGKTDIPGPGGNAGPAVRAAAPRFTATVSMPSLRERERDHVDDLAVGERRASAAAEGAADLYAVDAELP